MPKLPQIPASGIKTLTLLGKDCVRYYCGEFANQKIIWMKPDAYLNCNIPIVIQEDLFAEIISKIEKFDYDLTAYLNI